MNSVPSKKVIVGWALTLIAFVAVGVFAVWLNLERWRAPVRAAWSCVEVGLLEEEVYACLGEPRYLHDVLSAPSDYYVKGYGRKVRPISNRVLIYMGADMVFYVWIDLQGRVEETVIGVS